MHTLNDAQFNYSFYMCLPLLICDSGADTGVFSMSINASLTDVDVSWVIHLLFVAL